MFRKKKEKSSHSGGSSREQLLKKLSSSGLWKKVEVQERAPGTEKMSDVLLRFGAPLLEAAPDDASYEFGLKFCILAWNVSLLHPIDRAEQRLQILKEFPKEERDEAKAIFDMLLERKAKHFSKYRRAIVEYTLSSSENERHLSVASMEMKR
jgi:hypothetical protein